MLTVFDCETTITPSADWQEGKSLLDGGNPSPYLPTNELVSLSYIPVGGVLKTHFKDTMRNFQEILDRTETLIGFNIKFDLSWIRSCGFAYEGDIYDCQLVEYLLGGGRVIQPSLNEVATMYNLPLKKDEVKRLWEAGINTNEIDPAILQEYGEYDVLITKMIYEKQQERLNEYRIGHNQANQRVL